MKILDLKKLLVLLLIINSSNSGCTKDFLNEKPSSSIILPQSIEEFQLLMENMSVHGFTINLPLLSSDELEYINFDTYQALSQNTPKNAFIWAKDIFSGEIDNGDWNNPYKSIFYSNNVIVGLDKINLNAQNESKWKLIKGWAYFCRSFAYFDLAKNFSPAFDQSNAQNILGVPIRLNPSIDEILPRASQRETYDRIIDDLKNATSLLEPVLPLNRNQPSKITCFAFAARVYLSMGDYAKAELYADSSLQLYNKLIDYNVVSLTDANPFRTNDTELLYHTTAPGIYTSLIVTTANTRINIPEEIIKLYTSNDLRLPIFFAKRSNGTYVRKRGYQKSGSYTATGLAVDEIYLIKSECAVRRGDVTVSLKYLNDLLVKRFKTGSYIPIAISDPNSLLSKVLIERQKELIWRGLRWDDIRRLNRDGANIILNRVLNGITYTITPNDPRYTFPIPDNEIALGGLQQNPR